MNAPLLVARTEAGLPHHNAIVLGRAQITDVKLEYVEILKTHGGVRNWVKNWSGDEGDATDYPRSLPGREREKQDPWTVTVGGHLQLRVRLVGVPTAALPEDFCVEGWFDGPQFNKLKFVHIGPLRGGGNVVDLVSKEPLPRWPALLIGTLELKITNVADLDVFFTHAIDLQGAVTFGPATWADPNDAGATWKRVTKAAQRFRDLGATDLHGVAHHMMSLVEVYTTDPSAKKELQELGHPRYQSGRGGAWNILDYIDGGKESKNPLFDDNDRRAECQAIVRLGAALMHQVGCPGDFARVNVWADKPGGAIQLLESEDRFAGLPAESKAGAEFHALLASELRTGSTYEAGSAGINRYEACLRVRSDGVTKYYAGGIAFADHAFPTIEAVLKHSFTYGLALCRWTKTSDANEAKHQFVFLKTLHKW